MREVGLHLRLQDSLDDIIEKAMQHNLSFFQCFFIQNSTGKRIQVSDHDVAAFRRYRTQHLNHLYVHGSYWINLSDTTRQNHPALKYEMSLAKRLSFTHIVLHPGSRAVHEKKMQGIDALARSLNVLSKSESDIGIVLENTAHGDRSIGSDISDFGLLLTKLDRPERVQFCIDTAHAFAYGYNIATDYGREKFITTLENTIGVDNIALMHVNDSKTTCGSRVDSHAILDQGCIKEEALKKLVLDDRLAHIPLILELPVITAQQEIAILEQVQNWHNPK